MRTKVPTKKKKKKKKGPHGGRLAPHRLGEQAARLRHVRRLRPEDAGDLRLLDPGDVGADDPRLHVGRHPRRRAPGLRGRALS